MESFILSLVIAISGVVGTYAVLRHRVASLENDLKEHYLKDDKLHSSEATHHEVIHKEFITKFDAGFKKLDTVIERVIVIEQETKDHLNLREADERFVSHRELQLHLSNIENSMQHISKNSDAMTKKLEELTHILSNNIVKTLSSGEIR